MKILKITLIISSLLIGLASFRAGQPDQKITHPASLVARADTARIDAETGMIDDPNLMMVKAQCTACHSSKLILQHRFTRAGWLDRIRWMQQYHKLWDLGESEKVVLDYLEKHYSPANPLNNNVFRQKSLPTAKWYKLE
ncbi:MAG: hypothetical protein H7319_18575 [Spirosoma sp.]|nr:hypothetical protein [Spirosoma sp.]